MFGHLTLVSGPEDFLAERAVARLVAQARDEAPGVGVTTVAGADLTPGTLDLMSGTDLFSTAAVACVVGAEKTPKAVEPALIRLARAVPDNVALIVAHAGGNQARSLLEHLTTAARTVVDCQVIKAKSLPQFVIGEVRAAGKTIAPPAAQNLVDSIGADTRALAAAVSQLVADTDSDSITAGVVNQYFAGRATVTAYAVSDDALAGKAGEAIVKLRWALSTGVPHVLVTTALAGSLRQIGNYLAVSRTRQPTAADVGAPSWKMRDIGAASRSWSERSVGAAIRAVALADAQIKGAAQDPDFALESLIIRLAALRRPSR